MELQVSRPDTWIEKMQEMFKKELEEIKNSRSVMNNAIVEIKDTLWGNQQ